MTTPSHRVAGGRLSPEPLRIRSEEHTSELQSLRHLVCRLLLEKKKAVVTRDLAIMDQTGTRLAGKNSVTNGHAAPRLDATAVPLWCTLRRSRQLRLCEK